MKLLCDSTSGEVLAKFSSCVHPDELQFHIVEPVACAGQVLISVPESVAIPEAILRVILSADKEPEFVMDSSNVEQLWSSIKRHRGDLLKESDWICSIMDYTVPNKDAWIAYRQALRDITKQANPFRIVWPSAPSLSP